jgi:hypothetical protein
MIGWQQEWTRRNSKCGWRREMIGNERRLSQEEFKQRAGKLIKMFGRDGFDDLPLWMQVTVLAALKTGNEDDFAIELRKSFYLFDEADQGAIVEAAFDDASEKSPPIRRLISELPREPRVKILNSVQITQRR